MAKENQDEKLATKEDVEELIREFGNELLSNCRKALLEAMDRLEKMQISPGNKEVYRIVLKDVRRLIKGILRG